MTCKPGNLILIPFPYSDLQAIKKRPVLALTSPDRHGDFICLAITSVRTEKQAIQIVDTFLEQGTLPKISWIRLDKIFTLSETSIIESFGHLKNSAMQEVLKGLCTHVGYVCPATSSLNR